MDDTLASQLLASVTADTLAVFCGAGLSMAPPSSVPSARSLARHCAARYESEIGQTLDPTLHTNLDELCKFALARSELFKLLLGRFVEWRPFFRDPNPGHFAIADFLAASAIRLGVTTNFDTLVERAAEHLGADDFRAALDSLQGNEVREHQPYLKIHGCGRLDRENTLWCKEQIAGNPTLTQRLASCKTWLQSNLAGKDLVFIGFWSDWDYLNDVFEECVIGIEPRLVIVVDPSEGADLKAKAKRLWDWADSGKHEFHHVRQSGAEFLEELRRRFSFRLLESIINDSKATFTAITGRSYSNIRTFNETLSTEELYSFRRDAAGVSRSRLARDKTPAQHMRIFGSVQMRLVEAGAQLSGARFVLNSRRIRVVQGSGNALSLVKTTFSNDREDSSPVEDDIVICAGAFDDGGVPVNIVQGEREPSIIRPNYSSQWLTEDRAFRELSIV